MLSRFARRKLNAAGLRSVKVFASGNLDEFKIKELLRQHAQVDSFGVGTNMGTSIDAPCLDVIYKLSEVTDESGRFLPTMKLSRGKLTYPGRKQVFRLLDKKGNFKQDVIGLEKERIEGNSLLKKVVTKGEIIYNSPPLEKIRSYLQLNLSCFPQKIRDISLHYGYPVSISPGLNNLRRHLSRNLRKIP
jgi:nicotinate phosphoribosyltransferase